MVENVGSEGSIEQTETGSSFDPVIYADLIIASISSGRCLNQGGRFPWEIATGFVVLAREK